MTAHGLVRFLCSIGIWFQHNGEQWIAISDVRPPKPLRKLVKAYYAEICAVLDELASDTMLGKCVRCNNKIPLEPIDGRYRYDGLVDGGRTLCPTCQHNAPKIPNRMRTELADVVMDTEG